MANLCANKVVVIGPSEAVKDFVTAAQGPILAVAGDEFPTERRIVEEVRGGKPIDEAFRDANLRIDAINHGLSSLPFAYEMSGDAILKPVPAEGFEEWAEDIEQWRATFAKLPKAENEHSHLSFISLVPEPDEVRNESYRLTGYNWRIAEWGCKHVEAVGEPALMDVPSFAGTFDVDLGEGAGDMIAVYPNFDTPDAPVFPGLLNASRKHPDLLFLSAFVDADTEDYRFFSAKAGAAAYGHVSDRNRLPASCLEVETGPDEGDEPETYVRETETLNYLTGMASLQSADLEEAPRPGQG